MTPEQRTALQQLAAQFPQFDRAVRWANGDESRPVTGTTQPNADKWTVFDKFRIDLLRQLANAASITNGDFDTPAVVKNKIETWWAGTTQAAKNAVLLGLLEFIISELMDNKKGAQTTDTVPVPDVVEYGPSASEQAGFPNGITEEMLREAARQ